MTPLQVIMLGKRMRDAQRRWGKGGIQVDIEVASLEKAFDDAIAPYVDYVKAVEVQDG